MSRTIPRIETPRVIDNDRDEITCEMDGCEIRGWSYANEAERRVKMLAAKEFAEGWFQALVRDRAHIHAAGTTDSDECAICGHDIRHPIHPRGVATVMKGKP